MKFPKIKMPEKLRVAELSFFILLIIQMVSIAYSNLTLIETQLDSDNAKVFRHVIEMWEQGTINIPGWSYVSTMELDCGTLFALPLYAVTGNIYLSFGLSNILLTCIFVATIFFMFHGKEKIYPLISCCLICIPYQIGMLDYYNMLFFCASQYIIKVLVPLMLVAIIRYVESGKEKAYKDWYCIVFTIVYILFLFVTGVSSGSYVLLCGVAPIVLAYAIYKFFKWERVPGYIYVNVLLSLVVGAVGIKANNFIMGGAKAGTMKLCGIGEIADNMSATFYGMFELYGGFSAVGDNPVMSLAGICALVKICLVLLMLGCALYTIIKCFKKEAELIHVLLLSLFLCNYFFISVVNTRAGAPTSEYRYHLIGMLSLSILTVIVLLEGVGKLNSYQHKILLAGAWLGLALLSAVSYRQLFTTNVRHENLKELCDYCDDYDWDYVYLFMASGEADICRAIDTSANYLYMKPDGMIWTYDFYGQYVDVWPQTENAVVAIDNKYYAPAEDGTFIIGDYTLVKFDTVGGRDMYYFAEDHVAAAQ